MAQRAEPAAQPPLAPLGRRLRQRVARGSAALDARIDLHGLTQENAHHALRAFLRGAQADGAKLVLVITGKGARADSAYGGERGVLKRLVPQWLRLPELRATVVGFEPAHVNHGGEGALYVRIRRSRGNA
jgi:DNA-nicking Smr family endonuclease